MAHTANVLLTFDKTIQVTIRDNGEWEATDPHQVLEDNAGKWTFHPTSGTELNGLKQLQVIIVGWQLSSATKNEEGIAYRFPRNENDLGDFKVTLAV